MKKTLILFTALCCTLALSSCNGANTGGAPTADTDEIILTDEVIPMTGTKMKVQIAGASFTATLEDNAAVRELIEMMNAGPVTVDMRDYAGFEKVGALGRSLTTDDHQTTTTAGDIVLYNGNQIVIFYGSNAWSYTRIGRIDDLSGWEAALGSGDVTAVFSLAADGE